MPWVAFAFLMGHLAVNQLARQFINDPSLVDITGAQMVMVMKLTAFCWNVADGQLPDDTLTDFQRERAIKQLPSLLDFAAYVLFFPSLFAGPSFDFVDYKNWIETTMFELPQGTSPSKAAPTRKKRKIPRSGTPAAWKAAAGVAWIVLFIILSSRYNMEMVLGDDFMQYGFLRRVWLLHMFGFTSRLPYYGVWSLTEGSCILSGLGYNGIDPVTGGVLWDRLCNVNPWGVESAQNTRAYLGNWNINTNNWLRNYIFLRVTPKGKKPGFRATTATFIASAFWHGFYPGYYLAFVTASFAQTIAKSTFSLLQIAPILSKTDCRRYFRPFFIDPKTLHDTDYKIYYDILSWLITQVSFSFMVAPFVLLTLPKSLLLWGRVYYYGVVGVALGMAFFASPAKVWLKSMSKSPASAAEVPQSNDQLIAPVLKMPSHPQADMRQTMKDIKDIKDKTGETVRERKIM